MEFVQKPAVVEDVQWTGTVIYFSVVDGLIITYSKEEFEAKYNPVS